MPDTVLNLAGAIRGVDIQPLELNQPFEDLAARFAAQRGTVVLMSGGDLDCARYHILGVAPWLELWGRADDMNLRIDGKEYQLKAEPFALLRSALGRFALDDTSALPISSGLLGYLAYDLKDRLERLPRTSIDDLGLPHLYFAAPSVLVIHDRQTGAASLCIPQREKAASAGVLDDFLRALADPPPRPGGYAGDSGGFVSNYEHEPYLDAVRRIIEYIAAGDIYQANMSQRFEVGFSGDTFSLFRDLFAANPAPFFAYVNAGDHQLVSTSPERFLLQKGDWVETRPIKGTRPRMSDPARDKAMRDELTSSKKDDAELSMIVDLLRNDIGKSCAAGTVKVTEHKRLEAYRNVYHLVSLVEGRLAPDKDTVDLIEGCFPGGSITGCPKIRSMEIIDELEPNRRHIYTGSIGYLSFHQTMDLNIAIRTATIHKGKIYFSVGGGIVYDSDPQSEFEETLHKGRTLLDAFGGATGKATPEPMVWLGGIVRPASGARVWADDRGLLWGDGFFETIRCDEGKPRLMEAHLARFGRTWKTLNFGPEPDITWDEVIAQLLTANGLTSGAAAVKLLATRGRLAHTPDLGRAARPTLLVSARPYHGRKTMGGGDGLALATYPHPRQSPLAGHKTTNYLYYLQAAKWAAAQGADEALVLNPDGTVSETNTANIVAIFGDTAVTPASPHALPGVMLARVLWLLGRWGYGQLSRPMTPGELAEADAVILTNSLMGAAPVSAIDGAAVAQSDLWRRINGAIY